MSRFPIQFVALHYELYCLAQELGTHFIVRSCVDRMAGDGDQKLYALMDEVKIQGCHEVDVRDSKGNLVKASVEIFYRTLRVMPPIGKHKRYPALTLTAIMPAKRACRNTEPG